MMLSVELRNNMSIQIIIRFLLRVELILWTSSFNTFRNRLTKTDWHWMVNSNHNHNRLLWDIVIGILHIMIVEYLGRVSPIWLYCIILPNRDQIHMSNWKWIDKVIKWRMIKAMLLIVMWYVQVMLIMTIVISILWLIWVHWLSDSIWLERIMWMIMWLEVIRWIVVKHSRWKTNW